MPETVQTSLEAFQDSWKQWIHMPVCMVNWKKTMIENFETLGGRELVDVNSSSTPVQLMIRMHIVYMYLEQIGQIKPQLLSHVIKRQLRWINWYLNVNSNTLQFCFVTSGQFLALWKFWWSGDCLCVYNYMTMEDVIIRYTSDGRMFVYTTVNVKITVCFIVWYYFQTHLMRTVRASHGIHLLRDGRYPSV